MSSFLGESVVHSFLRQTSPNLSFIFPGSCRAIPLPSLVQQVEPLFNLAGDERKPIEGALQQRRMKGILLSLTRFHNQRMTRNKPRRRPYHSQLIQELTEEEDSLILKGEGSAQWATREKTRAASSTRRRLLVAHLTSGTSSSFFSYGRTDRPVEFLLSCSLPLIPQNNDSGKLETEKKRDPDSLWGQI